MLQNIPLFSNLEQKELDALSSHAVTKTYPKNSVIINEGDRTDSMYVIMSGRVKIVLTDENQKEVIIDIQHAGDYFGELALLDEAPRSASVKTMENSTFLIISKHQLQKCLREHPEIGIGLIRGLAQRLRATTGNVKSLALLDVYGRIARTLLQLANEEDGRQVISDKLTHQNLANMVGASREMVSRIMKDLADGGYIKTEGKTITIKEKLPPGW
ncbi:MAG: cyclic nucleotide-binding domain-containing protein [Gammaproteobacteria bacterium]